MEAMTAKTFLVVILVAVSLSAQAPPANPRQQPGAQIMMFAPEQHDLYDGHYILSANRIYMVGALVVASNNGIEEPERRRSIVRMTAAHRSGR